MATALKAKCPGCAKVATVESLDDSEVLYLTCDDCGKRFGLRVPKGEPKAAKLARAPQQTSLPAPVDDPFAGLSADLPSGPMMLDSYGVRRKPVVSIKALSIAIGVTLTIVVVVGLAVFVSKKAAQIDMSSISSVLQGPADSVDAIYAEWTRNKGEQEAMTKSIARQSDCGELALPMERLQGKQIELLVRLVRVDPQTERQLTTQALPAFPPASKAEGKSFRSIEAFLTQEFRTLETKLNQYNDAVLSALHVAIEPLPEPSTETEKKSVAVIAAKQAACRALAEAHRGEDTSKTAVAIYELAEELKKARAGVPVGTKVVTTLPASLQKADLSADRTIDSLADRFTSDENSEISKALKTLKQSF